MSRNRIPAPRSAAEVVDAWDELNRQLDELRSALVRVAASTTASGSGSGHVIQRVGIDMAQRRGLDFEGGVSVTDNAGGLGATKVTVHNQVHAIDGSDHTGSLAHTALSGVTANQHHNQVHAIDGADHTGSLAHSSLSGVAANQHHNQSHVLATTAGLGADHTTSGLTSGQVLRASGATTAAFSQLAHTDLSGVTSDQHHAKLHTVTDTAHHTFPGGTTTFLRADGTFASATPSLVVFDQSTTVSVASTSVETTLLSGTITGSLTLPANFWTVGKTLRVLMVGTHSLASGGLTIRAKLGGSTLGSAALTSSGSAYPSMLEVWMTCRTTGASGVIASGGVYRVNRTLSMDFTEPAAHFTPTTTTLDTTGTLVFDITAEPSISSASNGASAIIVNAISAAP